MNQKGIGVVECLLLIGFCLVMILLFLSLLGIWLDVSEGSQKELPYVWVGGEVHEQITKERYEELNQKCSQLCLEAECDKGWVDVVSWRDRIDVYNFCKCSIKKCKEKTVCDSQGECIKQTECDYYFPIDHPCPRTITLFGDVVE